MNFMPDIYVTCETCDGKRFNLQTLQVRFGEFTIADVLNMTIDQAIKYFDGFSKIVGILQSLADVGLGRAEAGHVESLDGVQSLPAGLAHGQDGRVGLVVAVGEHRALSLVVLDAAGAVAALGLGQRGQQDQRTVRP